MDHNLVELIIHMLCVMWCTELNPKKVHLHILMVSEGQQMFWKAKERIFRIAFTFLLI